MWTTTTSWGDIDFTYIYTQTKNHEKNNTNVPTSAGDFLTTSTNIRRYNSTE